MIADRLLQVLNEAYQADPVVIHCMLCSQWPTLDTFDDHPSIIVGCSPIDNTRLISMLGLLNGFIPESESKAVAMKWTDEKDEYGRLKFIGFTLIDLNVIPEDVKEIGA